MQMNEKQQSIIENALVFLAVDYWRGDACSFGANLVWEAALEIAVDLEAEWERDEGGWV